MAEYRLINALPQSLPGSTEFHYGYKCEVRQDGIWVELDELTAENFVIAQRISGPVQKASKPAPKQEPVVEEKPQEVVEVIEPVSVKRGPKKAQ